MINRDQIKTEIFDLFARHGSGDYQPTEREIEILNAGLDTVLESIDKANNLLKEVRRTANAEVGKEIDAYFRLAL